MVLLSSDKLLKVIPEEVQTAQSLHASMDWVRKVIKSAHLRRNLETPSTLKMAQIFITLICIGFDIQSSDIPDAIRYRSYIVLNAYGYNNQYSIALIFSYVII